MFGMEKLRNLLEEPTEEEKAQMILLREEKKRKEMDDLCKATGRSAEDTELLLRFAQAAGNLYGRIFLEDFYRIVRKLAPELNLDQETLFSFLRELNGKEYLYVLDSEAGEYAPETMKMTMNCDLVAQWVAWDYGDAWEILRERHELYPRYVPDREEFLRYADDRYYEETPAKQKMRDFLMKWCELQGEDLEGWLHNILGSMYVSTDMAAEKVLEYSVDCYRFNPKIFRQILLHSTEFAQCVGELHEHVRRPYTNGHTLAELRKMQAVTDIEVVPKEDFSEYELLPEYERKVGRNDPCPCGSGKKYKKCCGRGK